MTTYTKRVADNMLPRSNAQSLPDAMKEWAFTGSTLDHVAACEQCELCEQEGVRYHYQIENEHTGASLWVGSSCILKFDIAVQDAQGRRLTPEDAKRELDRLMEEMRLQSCLEALDAAAHTESNDILAKALAYYRQRGHLTPKFAFVVFWRLTALKIDHSPSFFKISLRRDSHKRDLQLMAPDRVRMLWPALTTAQRRLAVEYGHRAPPSRQMIGEAAANGWSYEMLSAMGWSDAQLVARGMMR